MYSENFKYAIEETLEKEGVFSDDKQDPGGRTMYGITEHTWKAWRIGREHLPENVAAITVKQATDVYHAWYWAKFRLDTISSKYVAAEIFDTGVNCGPKNAAYQAQRAINYCRKEDWGKIAVDGAFGPITRAAIERILGGGYLMPLLEALNGEQYRYYADLDRPRFSRGWTRRLAIAKELG